MVGCRTNRSVWRRRNSDSHSNAESDTNGDTYAVPADTDSYPDAGRRVSK
jgi:hypothetical protein